MKSESKSGLTRIWYATLYSFSGLKSAFKNESAFREEILVFVILLILLLSLPFSAILRIVLLFCNISVLVAELLNSAIESVVDKVSPEYDELAKQSKDMGSAAVFLTIVSTIIAWSYALYSVFFV